MSYFNYDLFEVLITVHTIKNNPGNLNVVMNVEAHLKVLLLEMSTKDGYS